MVGGGLTSPVDTFGLAVGHVEKHPHRPQSPLEGIRDVFTQLQCHMALLVLPTGPKTSVMNPHGLTGQISRVKKQTWLCTVVLSVCQESVWI